MQDEHLKQLLGYLELPEEASSEQIVEGIRAAKVAIEELSQAKRNETTIELSGWRKKLVEMSQSDRVILWHLAYRYLSDLGIEITSF